MLVTLTVFDVFGHVISEQADIPLTEARENLDKWLNVAQDDREIMVGKIEISGLGLVVKP